MIVFALVLLFVLIVLGMYIGPVLALLGIGLEQAYSDFPLLSAVGDISWNASTDFILVAVPLFVLMGEILLRSGVTDRMFQAIDPLVSWLPGRLMHTNIASAALFGSASGSSVATAAAITTVSLPNMERHKYNPQLFLGTLAAGGTLGILIPPSINMVVYAMMANASLGALYLASLIPSVLLTAMFSLVVVVACLVRPEWGGIARPVARTMRWFMQIVYLVPPLILLWVVIAPIYFGWATPTEAAALGVLAALVLGLANGRMGWKELRISIENTARTTCMVMLIVLAALFLNFVMVAIGLTDAVTNGLLGLGLSPFTLLLGIIVFYLILGCVMETMSMMIATTPIIVPVIVKLGYSEVWWGIVFVILMEAALITPPIGLNLLVVQASRKSGRFAEVAVGSIPFVIAMVVLIGLLIAFPGLALWLPGTMAK
ncbi:MAG: TRAP transporter large permease [Reyranellaceae bacterium]